MICVRTGVHILKAIIILILWCLPTYIFSVRYSGGQQGWWDIMHVTS